MKRVNENLNQLVSEKFGFNVEDVMETPLDDAVMSKIRSFIQSDEKEQLALYSISANTEEIFKRQALQVCQELIDNDHILQMSDGLPSSFERKIKQTFVGYFPDFDSGAARSYGRYLSGYLRWARKEPGFFENPHHYIRIHNFIMGKLKKNSKAKFFVKTRINYRMWMSFEKLSESFCKSIHFVEMNRVESDTKVKEAPKPKLRLASNNDNQSKKKENAVSETDYAQQTNFGFIQ